MRSPRRGEGLAARGEVDGVLVFQCDLMIDECVIVLAVGDAAPVDAEWIVDTAVEACGYATSWELPLLVDLDGADLSRAGDVDRLARALEGACTRCGVDVIAHGLCVSSGG